MDNEVAVLLHGLHGHDAVSDLSMSFVRRRGLPVGEQLRESPLNDQPISTRFRLTHTVPNYQAKKSLAILSLTAFPPIER
ncbi:MAG: hypothetical protein A49_32630 [Methyloceanibacter sp.]|nr:MAG: hypothetical protein A49_32630 [Methyloceanibacter sp.]